MRGTREGRDTKRRERAERQPLEIERKEREGEKNNSESDGLHRSQHSEWKPIERKDKKKREKERDSEARKREKRERERYT